MEFPDDSFRNKKDVTKPTYYMSFKYYVMIYVFFNFLMCLFLEKVVSHYIIRNWITKKMKEKQRKIQKEEIKPNLNLLNEIKNYTKTMNKI